MNPKPLLRIASAAVIALSALAGARAAAVSGVDPQVTADLQAALRRLEARSKAKAECHTCFFTATGDVPLPQPRPQPVRPPRKTTPAAAPAAPSGTKWALPRAFFAEGADCSGYIKRNGEYGPKGQFIANLLNADPAYYSAILSNSAGGAPSMQRICPGYNRLGASDRIRFWVWTSAAISWDETKCGASRWLAPKMDTTGRMTVGEFQMNYTHRDRSWRGQRWSTKRYCNKRDISGFQDNARCAFDILVGQFKGEYGRPPGLAGPSYWAKLRTGDRPSRWETSSIINRVRTFPGCRP